MSEKRAGDELSGAQAGLGGASSHPEGTLPDSSAAEQAVANEREALESGEENTA